jgi:hypothetical protein
MVLRSTHFQSSLMSDPLAGMVETSSMELRALARLMARALRMPGSTLILRFSAGIKLASETRTE